MSKVDFERLKLIKDSVINENDGKRRVKYFLEHSTKNSMLVLIVL